MSDATTAAIVGPLLGLFGTAVRWVMHRIAGDKRAGLRALLESVVTQILYSGDVDLDNVKARIESAARIALSKAGVTGALADELVHEVVEYGAAKLHERFDEFTRNLESLSAAADKVKQELKP